MKTVPATTKAWNAGYIAGHDGQDVPCPFTEQALRDEWYSGYFKGEARRRSELGR